MSVEEAQDLLKRAEKAEAALHTRDEEIEQAKSVRYLLFPYFFIFFCYDLW